MIPYRLIWMQYLVVFILTYYFVELQPIFGLILPILFTIDFLKAIGNKIPLREMICLILSIQCMLVPFLYYNSILNVPEIYQMAVSQQEYFAFIVPAFSLFAIGLSLLKEPPFTIVVTNYDAMYNVARTLIIIGVLLDFILPFTPRAIGFFVFQLSNIKFIGAIYMLFSKNKNYIIWVLLAFINLIIYSISNAFFQELLGWSMFFILYYFHRMQTTLIRQIVIISSLLVGIFVLQNIKSDFRTALTEDIQHGKVDQKVNTFVDQFVESASSDQTFSETNVNTNFVRFNQGYIISRIMYHVPRYEPYAQGATIKDALYSSLIPRFLDPSKTTVGGSNGYYTRFTGYELIGGTSMDLSIMGEIYANYGRDLGLIAALIAGLLYNVCFSLFLLAVKKDAQLIFWLPYLFLINVRPENSFVAVLNFMTKSTIILIFIYNVYLKNKKNIVQIRLHT